MYIEVVRGTEKGGSPSIFNETMLNAIKQISGTFSRKLYRVQWDLCSILKSFLSNRFHFKLRNDILKY